MTSCERQHLGSCHFGWLAVDLNHSHGAGKSTSLPFLVLSFLEGGWHPLIGQLTLTSCADYDPEG